MDEQTDGRTDGQILPCVLQDFVPFGATAQKGGGGRGGGGMKGRRTDIHRNFFSSMDDEIVHFGPIMETFRCPGHLLGSNHVFCFLGQALNT